MEIKIFTHRIDSPESLDGRKNFTFSKASNIVVKDGDFKNLHVTIISDEPPLITYEKGPHCIGCRYAEDSDLIAHCVRKGNEYTFPCVQRNCVWFGKSVWD